MAVTITPIDLGTVAGDGTGDTAREGGTKINANEANLKAAVETLQSAPAAHTHEGTAILSTGEGGGTKVLTEQGDGSSAWAEPSALLMDARSDQPPRPGALRQGRRVVPERRVPGRRRRLQSPRRVHVLLQALLRALGVRARHYQGRPAQPLARVAWGCD